MVLILIKKIRLETLDLDSFRREKVRKMYLYKCEVLKSMFFLNSAQLKTN